MLKYYAQQTNYTCGTAAMRMILEYLGIEKTEKQLARILHTNKVRGTWPRYLPRLAERYMLDYVVLRNADIKDIRELIERGYFVVILYLNHSGGDHYSIIEKVGRRYIHLIDPDYEFGPKARYAISYFMKMWESDPSFSRHQKRWLCAIKKP